MSNLIHQTFNDEVKELLEELKWWDLEEEQIKANIHILVNDDGNGLRELVKKLRRRG